MFEAGRFYVSCTVLQVVPRSSGYLAFDPEREVVSAAKTKMSASRLHFTGHNTWKKRVVYGFDDP